jgi:hypothetical protein
MSHYTSLPERIWYATGYLPKEAEQWGGLEKLSQIVPECLRKVKAQPNPYKEKPYLQSINISDEEYLSDSYQSFCSTLFVDLNDGFKDKDWQNHPAVKPLYDTYSDFQKSAYEWRYGGGGCMHGEILGLMMLGGITSGLITPISINIAKHYTQNQSTIAIIGTLSLIGGFIAGVAAIPATCYIVDEIKDRFFGRKEKREKLKKESIDIFLKRVDDYLDSHSAIS